MKYDFYLTKYYNINSALEYEIKNVFCHLKQ